MTAEAPSEVYEKMAKETGSKILARIYREAAYLMKQKETKENERADR